MATQLVLQHSRSPLVAKAIEEMRAHAEKSLARAHERVRECIRVNPLVVAPQPFMSAEFQERNFLESRKRYVALLAIIYQDAGVTPETAAELVELAIAPGP